MSDTSNQETSTPAEVDIQVVAPTEPDPQPAEGGEAEPAPETVPDPQPAEGTQAEPAPTAES